MTYKPVLFGFLPNTNKTPKWRLAGVAKNVTVILVTCASFLI